jgi:hypothetical protein
MWFFYFLPMLVAIGFLLARVAAGGSSTPRPSVRQIALALLAIVVLGVLGALLSGVLK